MRPALRSVLRRAPRKMLLTWHGCARRCGKVSGRETRRERERLWAGGGVRRVSGLRRNVLEAVLIARHRLCFAETAATTVFLEILGSSREGLQRVYGHALKMKAGLVLQHSKGTRKAAA